jgi:hypothetical protein
MRATKCKQNHINSYLTNWKEGFIITAPDYEESYDYIEYF